MNIITDRTKAPAKLHYRVNNNSGSINKEFGNDQQAAYDFANEIKETAIIRGYYDYENKNTRTIIQSMEAYKRLCKTARQIHGVFSTIRAL